MSTTQARKDLRKKRRLERVFTKDLRQLNNKISKQTAQAFAVNGEILNANIFFDDYHGTLLKNYNRTGKQFDSQLSDSFPQKFKATTEEIGLIAAALATYYLFRAPQQTRFILNTTQKQINESIILGLKEESDSLVPGQSPSRRNAAANAGIILKRKLNGRNTGIANTEVNNIAERAKQTESTLLLTKPNVDVPPVKKEWVTTGRETVRRPPDSKFNHVAADGQKVNLDETFTVSGQSLLVPSDTSNGASLGNVINCRCASVVDEKSALTARRVIFDAETRTETTEPVDIPAFAF